MAGGAALILSLVLAKSDVLVCIGQFEKNIAVAGIAWPAGADQVLAAELARIEAFVSDVIAIDELGRFAPAAALICGLHVRLAAQSLYVRLPERVCPFRAMANEHRVFMGERVGGDG